MRNNSFIKWALALALVTLLFASAYPAFAATYTVKGKVVDNSGNGVPGAKVTLEQAGLQIGDVLTTANDGSYLFEMDSLPGGTYQLFGEKEGKTNSVTLTVSSGYFNYSASPIMLRNYLVSGVPVTATPTATPTPTPLPSVTPTPTPAASTAPDNATATPVATATLEATATAAPSSTPAPSPGFVFVLVPAALALCFIAMRKKN